jgi:hypothetical protein
MQTPLAYAQIRSCETLIGCSRTLYGWTYHGIPRSCAQTQCIIADTKTADTVIVPLQCANALATENVPDLEIG